MSEETPPAALHSLHHSLTALESGALRQVSRHLHSALREFSQSPIDPRHQPFTATYFWAVLGFLKSSTGDALGGAQFALQGLRLMNRWTRPRSAAAATDGAATHRRFPERPTRSHGSLDVIDSAIAMPICRQTRPQLPSRNPARVFAAKALVTADCLAALGVSLTAAGSAKTGRRCLARASELHHRGGDATSSASDLTHIAALNDDLPRSQVLHLLRQAETTLGNVPGADMSPRASLTRQLIAEMQERTSPRGRSPLQLSAAWTGMTGSGP